MMGLEAQQHLKDHLFNGVQKYIHDFVWCLYNTPGTSYLQLMVASKKAESKSEETLERIRTRAAVATKPGERMVKLGQQIAQLMAALTETG